MVFAWGMLLSVAILGQVYLKDIYMLMAVANGERMPNANFPTEAQRGPRGFGTGLESRCFSPSYLGIWAIKLNSLLFVKRFGTQVAAYLIFWLAVLVILWKVQIDLKKRILLAGIFSLVSFTIAVTIVNFKREHFRWCLQDH
jgi:hypothetical protein